ncbi:MAG: hypothetical protein ACLFUM_11090 [Spirochaetaceae bacterium]
MIDMHKRAATFLALAAATLLPVAGELSAEHVPSTPDGELEVEAVSRVFVKLDRLEPMLEAVGRFEGEDLDFRYRAVTAGGYYRVHRNVKVGAFYRLQAGARHDDDWVLRDGDWEWRETSSRAEHVLLGDVTPRLLLDFLPGESWVFALKNRYFLNTFNAHQTLLTRPQLTYFLLRAREPVVNVSVAYGLYWALDFSDQALYRHSPYLEVLYHATDAVKLTAGFTRNTVHWSSSEDVAEAGATDYSVDGTSWLLTAGLIFRVDPGLSRER